MDLTHTEFSPNGDYYRTFGATDWLSSERWSDGRADAIALLTEQPFALGKLELGKLTPSEILWDLGMVYEGDDGYIDGWLDLLNDVYNHTVDGQAVSTLCHKEAQRRMVASFGKESK